MLQEVVYTPAADTVTDFELRREPRHRCGRVRLTRVVAKPSFKCMRAFVRDISRTGICLRCFEPVEPGGRLALDWDFADFPRQRTRLARVVHATLEDDKIWTVGCEFEEPLGDEEVAALVGLRSH